MQITQDQFEQIKTLHKSGIGAMKISKILNIKFRQVQYRLDNINRSKMCFSPKNYDFFEKIDTEEKAYWLGFIYADGCITGENNNAHKICIGLKKSDKDHLQKLADIFEINLKKNIQYTNQNFDGEYESIRFEICNKKIFEDLENCGIKQRKTYEETTDILDYVSDNLIHHFVRGVFDGDGSVSYKTNSKNNYLCFNITGSNDILKKIQKIIMNKIGLNETKIQQMSEYCWSLQYGGKNNITLFHNWLYKDSTVWLERKKIIFEEIIYPIYLDKEFDFTGVVSRPENTKNPFRCHISIDACQENIGSFSTELEAAYYHDLEQVRRRGENAKQYMNFPSRYDDFVQWIHDGIINPKQVISDKLSPPYTGVTKKKTIKKPYCSRVAFNGKSNHIGKFETELEAAYYHDLEQVRLRGKEAKTFMNFPSKYNDFVQWIQDGY